MNGVTHARHYLSGLLGKQRRKNIETIENDVAGSDYQGMEQFVSSSPWSHEAVMEQVASEADRLIGDEESAGFYIDESSFVKKGKASVGVQRQWCGRLGKLENCQVGVFACLGAGERYAITDYRLYLPEQWAEDARRCDKAKIPEEHREYRPKWKLALEMVFSARRRGMRFGFVGCDSLYGSNALFLNALEDAGELFMADVDKSKQVWLEEPLIQSPTSCGTERAKQGRPRKHPRLDAANEAGRIRVGELAARLRDDDFRELAFRQGSKGKVCGRFWMGEVWHWERGESRARRRRLLVRKDADGSMKYSLTNLPEGKQLVEYARAQGQRYWIEHAFHEAKSQLGMAQYQVRVWRGWHHHMALVCMAQLFVETHKKAVSEEAPLLTARDITELLAYYLPRRDRTEVEVHEQIRKRHEKRRADIERREQHLTGLP
ncbi:MAG: IS701 family transposase [Verrucomicrobiales bacterium]